MANSHLMFSFGMEITLSHLDIVHGKKEALSSIQRMNDKKSRCHFYGNLKLKSEKSSVRINYNSFHENKHFNVRNPEHYYPDLYLFFLFFLKIFKVKLCIFWILVRKKTI